MYAVAASLLWSLNPALISRLGKNVGPLLLTSMRALLALLFLAPFIVLDYHELYRSLSDIRSLFIIAISAILGPGIGDTAYTRAIQSIGGSLAVVISYTYILVAQIIAVFIINENTSLFTVIGGLIAFLGIVIASYDSNVKSMNIPGALYGALASLSWGIASAIMKYITDTADPLSITAIRLVIVFTVFSMISFLFKRPGDISEWKQLLALSAITGILGWGIGMYLFIYSISTIGVSATVLATALTPVLSQITVRIIAREKPRGRVIVGALTVSIGIFIASF
ncbi:MAG: DMT family transporter [Desulfurococcaceae archaeon]